MSGQNESAAWPKAEDGALVQELLDCVQQASHYRQLKKGANEATKSYVHRKVSLWLVLVGIQLTQITGSPVVPASWSSSLLIPSP